MKKLSNVIWWIIFICSICFIIFIGYKIYDQNNNEKENDNDNKNNNVIISEEEDDFKEVDDDNGLNKKVLKQAHVNQDGTIYFPDVNFESSIKSYLKVDQLSVDSVVDVTKLELKDCEIRNIAGIEYFKNIEFLNLMENGISDISNLKDCKNLKRLFLEKNLLSDISVVSNLEQLEILNVGTNNIKDISAIRNLHKLSGVVFNGNPIQDYQILFDKVDEMSVNDAHELNISENDDYIISQSKHQKTTYSNDMIAINDMKKWVNDNIKSDMSDLEKEYKIINHILDRVSYAYDNRASEIDIYGAYEEGRTVCFGYALIFKYLCDFSGLECYQVGTNLSTESIQAGNQNHVWNIVKIDDKYYQVDLTWADTNDVVNYNYINVSNETMEMLHKYGLPIFSYDGYSETNSEMSSNLQQKYYK